jgi:hypothetical protein
MANDADLVVLEGMVRFSCPSFFLQGFLIERRRLIQFLPACIIGKSN